MEVYIVKVEFEDGTLMPPLTVACGSEEKAVEMVRELSFIDEGDKVESKGIRQDVVKAAFGDQPDGTIVTRIDWVWDANDQPEEKK